MYIFTNDVFKNGQCGLSILKYCLLLTCCGVTNVTLWTIITIIIANILNYFFIINLLVSVIWSRVGRVEWTDPTKSARLSALNHFAPQELWSKERNNTRILQIARSTLTLMGRECTHARILMSVNNRSVNITLVWKSCGNDCCEMCIANGGEISTFLRR